jgi:hypothetical protein
MKILDRIAPIFEEQYGNAKEIYDNYVFKTDKYDVIHTVSPEKMKLSTIPLISLTFPTVN